MFDCTQPRGLALDSIDRIAIGARLDSASGEGKEAARLLWFVILSRTPFDGAKRPTWSSNVTLALDAGLRTPTGQADTQTVKYGLQRLRKAGMLTCHHGVRPGASRAFGRILVPAIAKPVRVVMPDRSAMSNAWAMLREAGLVRPAATVATLQALAVLAGSPEHADSWPQVVLSTARLMRFIGVRGWTAHKRRLDSIVEAGLARWTTTGIAVAPTSMWRRSPGM